jgi:hypothetical protein
MPGSKGFFVKGERQPTMQPIGDERKCMAMELAIA